MWNSLWWCPILIRISLISLNEIKIIALPRVLIKYFSSLFSVFCYLKLNKLPKGFPKRNLSDHVNWIATHPSVYYSSWPHCQGDTSKCCMIDSLPLGPILKAPSSAKTYLNTQLRSTHSFCNSQFPAGNQMISFLINCIRLCNFVCVCVYNIVSPFRYHSRPSILCWKCPYLFTANYVLLLFSH